MLSKQSGLLPDEFNKSLTNSITKSGIPAWSLHDLRQTEVPVKHWFELKDEIQISHLLIRLPQKRNEIVPYELVKILDAGIFTPSISDW